MALAATVARAEAGKTRRGTVADLQALQRRTAPTPTRGEVIVDGAWTGRPSGG